VHSCAAHVFSYVSAHRVDPLATLPVPNAPAYAAAPSLLRRSHDLSGNHRTR